MTTLKPKSFLRRSLDSFIAVRQRDADRYVARSLLRFDDATLIAGGFDRTELERRARTAQPY